MNSNNLDPIRYYLRQLQDQISQYIITADKQGHWQIDPWNRGPTFGGITQIFRDGKHFEHAGVNFSEVKGKNLPTAATEKRPALLGSHFIAMGVSVVIHPRNPFVPTTHFNVRFFQAEKPGFLPVWWFGGGFDLTPYYAFEEDCIHWHRTAKRACAPFGENVYSRFKQWCDEYFFLKHRQEQRGIGGLFFDDLNEWPFETCFQFIQSVGNHFNEAYWPIVERRKQTPFGERERRFQCYRRGRYVEFNLLYDRGTLFGLQSGGRTESILMSLPPEVHWNYQWEAPPGSPEEQLTQYFLQPKNWA